IKDKGIGFEERFAEDIFKIFKRLNNASKYQGSGIGLALCSKIMQIHEGHIGASSIVGEGTVFRVYFPV
ncbi:MAG: PAS domain-containing sensor histidine kinase, partial [Chitinophagaceae bacterium]